MSQWTEDQLENLWDAVNDEAVMNAPLRATDRCDRCGAQAFIRVNLWSITTPLQFCFHDWQIHREALIKIAVHIQDDSAKLLVTP